MGDFELAWTSFDRPCKKFTSPRNPAGENRRHPTQKPVDLGIWILDNYAKPGDIILDCCAGSGAFIIAAIRLGFQWIAIERDPKYAALIEKRIPKHVQRRMF
jgi:site-specific DNA-methyltransferase (adenine-specific)